MSVVSDCISLVVLSVKDVYVPEMQTGFFPPPSTAAKPAKAAPDQPLEPPYRIAPDGFIPNSILTRLLWPEKVRREEKPYRPPMMNEEQMRMIAKMNKVRSHIAAALNNHFRASLLLDSCFFT